MLFVSQQHDKKQQTGKQKNLPSAIVTYKAKPISLDWHKLSQTYHPGVPYGLPHFAAYKVTISGVQIQGVTRTFSYTVTIFDPVAGESAATKTLVLSLVRR